MDGASTNGRPAAVAYFSEARDGEPGARLAAAVICRGTPAPATLRGGGGPLGWLRGIRHRLWLRLGPLGADVSVAGRSLFGGDAWAPRTVSSVEPHSLRAPLAYYDEASRVLRVLGRVLRVPPRGETLVALVDAAGPRAIKPRLVIRIVPTPAVAVERPEPAQPSPDFVESLLLGGEHPAWATALRADPVVRAFLDGHARP